MIVSTFRMFGVAALLSLGAVACSTSPTPASRTYNLDIVLEAIQVLQNCEDAVGNPGEWAWRVIVRVPDQRSLGAGTDIYPDREYTVSWSDGTTYPINRPLRTTGLSEADRQVTSITLDATEWDPDGPDPDMNNRSQTNPLPRSNGRSEVGLSGGARCSIRLQYSVTWTEM